MAKKKAKKAKKTVKRKRATQSSLVDHYPEGDARTLADASAIKADSGRFKRAQTASKKLIKEQLAQVEGLKKTLRGIK